MVDIFCLRFYATVPNGSKTNYWLPKKKRIQQRIATKAFNYWKEASNYM